MKSGWRAQPLGEVCSFLNRGVSPIYLDAGGICVLNQKCVRGHRVSFELSRRHDHVAKKVPNERLLRSGDVLVNSTGTGTLGRVAQLRTDPIEPTTVDSHITIVRPKTDRFFADFFGYMLVHIEEAIMEAGEGCGGQTELSRAELAGKFLVAFPYSLPEQQRIVRILDEAFAAIATAKANTEKNLQNAQSLLRSRVDTIFSARLDGWAVRTIDELSTNLDFKRVPITKGDRVSGEYPYYGASGIVDYVAGYIFEGSALLISEDGANLLARSTPIAFSASGRYWVNNHAHILKFEHPATQKYVEFYLESIALDQYITGTAQPKLNQKLLNSIPIPIPSSTVEQSKVVEQLVAIRAGTSRLESIYQQKIAALDDLKKSFLDQAFTGQL